VYRHFTKYMNAEERKEFDNELWAPVGGWDAAEAKVFDAMAEWVAEQEQAEGGG